MANEWYCLVSDNVLGPLSDDEVLAMAVAGNLAPTDMVRKEIDGRWVEARRLKGITFPDKSAPAAKEPENTNSGDVVNCPHCGETMTIRGAVAGTTMNCVSCPGTFVVPTTAVATDWFPIYFKHADGRVVGPLTGRELRKAAFAGKVVPTTLVAMNADGPWQPAKNVRGLSDDEGRPLPHPPETRRLVQGEPPKVPSVPSAADVVVPESQKGLTPHINPNNTSSAAFAERQKEMAPPPPRWWADCDGESQGPLDFSQVTAFLQSQKLRTSSLVCLEGTQEWQPISECPEFQVAIGSMLPPVESLPPRGGALVGQTSQKEAVRDEIREIAVRQRRLIIGIGLMCLGHFFGIVMINVAATVVAVSVGVEPDDPVLLTLVGFAALIFQLALLGCQVWLLYGVMQVLRITTRWLWVLGACLPCIGLLVLLAINQKATAKLRSAGITVGFFGADLPRLPR